MNGAERLVIVRYGEVGLKRGNRALFEKLLKRRLADALRGERHGGIERPHGRILVRAAADPWAAAERAARVFGVTSTSPALSAPREPQAIEAAASFALEEALARRGCPDGSGLTMKVESTRADKSFPLGSMELSRRVADAVLSRFRGFGVRMKEPDLTVGIEVRTDEALVFAERLRGPGGLPVGSLGRAVALLSGGIDSPVAAWLAMKRGLLVELLHFHAPPFVGEASREKALDLARALSRYGGRLRLWIAPFAAVQTAIRDGAPDPYRTLLYRRAMNRVAARLADSSNARALVTGESLGQVASQTLENLACIEDAAGRMVLRPLLTYDKEETIALARRIGTFEISSRPHPDCCTLFTPARPKIRGRLEELRDIEETLALEPLLESCWEGRELAHLAHGELLPPAPPGIAADRPGSGGER